MHNKNAQLSNENKEKSISLPKYYSLKIPFIAKET